MVVREEVETALLNGNGDRGAKPAASPVIVCSGKIRIGDGENGKTASVTVPTTYDPYERGTAEGDSSFLNIYLYLVLMSCGPALMCIPANFIAIGYGLGVGGILVTIALYAYCVRIVVANEYLLCKRYCRPSMSYSEMTRRAFECGPSKLRPLSRYVESAMNFLFVFVWLTGSSMMPVLVAENLQQSIKFLLDYDISVRRLMVWLAVPLMPMCWIRKLKYLAPFSIVNNAVNIASIGVIAWYTSHDLPSLGDRLAVGSVAELPLFVGVLLFSLNITGIVLPLKTDMKRPKRFNAKRGIVTATYVTIAAMYSTLAFVCFLKYGDKTDPFVIRNLPRTTFYMAVVGVYSLSVACVYPLSMYVPIDVVWNSVLKAKMAGSKYKIYAEYACRTILPIISFTIAFVVPNLDIFMLITGAVGTSIDSVIIPALTEILIYYDRRRYAMFAINGTIIVIGVMSLITGALAGVKKIIESI